MELVAQRQLPVVGQRRHRCRIARKRREDAGGLSRDEGQFGTAVELLGTRLRGQRGAVVLEIHLTRPGRDGRILEFAADAVDMASGSCHA